MEDKTKNPVIDRKANYDVVVLGFGGAGATAARFAADNDAKVLLVDIAPYGHEGGIPVIQLNCLEQELTLMSLKNIT